jgi:acetylornithine deacetylase/succinyl-diaminopimelate desuccinylase-like protein
VRDGDRLYGRGGADDGYAAFAAVTALQALVAAGGAHARVALLIEASEESGSPDLPAHVDDLAERLGAVDLVVCLDAGAGDYERLWLTTSLRGVVNLTVRAEVLSEAVHSGAAGGVVPTSTDVMRVLLDRIHDPATGAVRLPELSVAIPDERVAEARATAAELADPGLGRFPVVEGLRAPHPDPAEQLLAQTWRPCLEVIAADGLPAIGVGGNVLRPHTTLQLSLRLPPSVDPGAAGAALTRALVTDPPFGAHVRVDLQAAEGGWAAPATAPWLRRAVAEASIAAFGTEARSMGEGGAIPFMGMLGRRFPTAQFVVTGVLGPGANAHGPNECLRLDYAKRLTLAVAHLLDAHERAGA